MTNDSNGGSKKMESRALHRFVASAISAAAAETCTYPLDVTKTQMQARRVIRTTELRTGSFYLGIKEIHMFRRLEPAGFIKTATSILSKEGLGGFYKGLPAATARAVFNNGLSLTIYKPMLRIVTGRPIRSRQRFESKLWHKILAAFLTGSFTQLIANPVDVIKVRMQAEGLRDKRRFHGTFGAIRYIAKDGILSFWRGLGPSITRSALAVGSTIATYDHSKHYLIRKHQLKESSLLHGVSSAISGLVASVCSCPADVVKTRIMTQSFSNPVYNSVLHCLTSIIKNEGVLTLFKGFIPTYMRLGPWQVVFFVSYEKISVLLGGSNI